MSTRTDVQTRADVERIVKAFYGGIDQDPVLGRFFAGVDWDVHLPKMVSFWSALVFHTGEYKGRPFDPHAKLMNLEREHFGHWVSRFCDAVDEEFQGDRAEDMKQRARQIASVFQVKLGLWQIAGESDEQ